MRDILHNGTISEYKKQTQKFLKLTPNVHKTRSPAEIGERREASEVTGHFNSQCAGDTLGQRMRIN